MDDHFQNINTDIYRQHRERYLPTKIKFLIIAESPPAFQTDIPKAYFYFDNVPKADSLFYTIIKSVYDLDFEKYVHNRIEILKRFQGNGFYLIDAVNYPINKDKNWTDTSSLFREQIILKNQNIFQQHLQMLIDKRSIDSKTKSILIKQTVYKQYKSHYLLNVVNQGAIGFPSYIKDRKTIVAIRRLI